MKVAEGAVSSTVEILKTLKKKAIDAATDTNTDEDRAIIQKEIDQYVDQIDDNALVTFNGKYLLDGSKTPSGKATYGSMTNEALATNTTALNKLTDLYARNGEHLIIESTDQVTVSYVQGGRTYVTTFQVEDNTLGDIFRKAEDIDQSSKIFATSSNEDVAKASGLITGSTNKDVVDKSIAYLQDALSYNYDDSILDVVDASGNSTDGGASFKAAMDAGTSFIKLQDGGSGVLNITNETSASSLNDNLLSKDVTDAKGMSSSYNGEIFQQVKDALVSYNTIVNKMSDMGTALKNQLQSELGKTWDGDLGEIYNYKAEIYEKGSTDLIEYYESYTNAAAEKNSSKTNLDAAVKNYNEGIAQLDALKKLQTFETDKMEYTTAVDSFIQALRTEMSGSQEGTYTLAAGSAGNPKQISFDSGNSQLSDADRAAAIESIVSAVQNKLYELVDEASINLKDLATSSAKASTFYTSVIALIGNGLEKDSSGAVATNGLTVNTESSVLNVAMATGGGTEVGSASTFITGITNVILDDMEGSSNSAADLYGTNGTDGVLKYLDLAQNDVLASYSGPALLTGANVGVDATNHIVTTPDGKAGLTITAANSGLDGQIAGFSISISDAEGNVRKSVDTILNSWTVLNFARNESVEDNALKIHIGAAASQSISVGLADMRAHALGLKGTDGKVVDVSTQANANAAVAVFNNALQKALDQQTTIGAIEARLEYTSSNLTVSSENVQAAESVIRDADMAKEMTNYTKNNVLLQAAQSMLAQANQNSSAVLSLLQ